MKIIVALGLFVVASAEQGFSYFPSGYLPVATQNFGYYFPQHGFTQQNHLTGFAPANQASGFDGRKLSKNLYFFSPPPEEFQTAPVKVRAPPKRRKSYNIIFIKAPHHTFVPKVVVPPSTSKDRTVVFVLSPQPESHSITIPANFGVRHAKPQVYFLQYGNKQNLGAHIQNGINGNSEGVSATDFENKDNFLNALNSAQYGSQVVASTTSGPY